MKLARCSGIALLLLAGACRAAGPKVAAPQAPEPSFVQSYVGQTRILLGRGDQQSVGLKAGDLGRSSGDCDVAVVIERAAADKGGLRFGLSRLGRPRVEGGKPAKDGSCRSMPAGMTVSVADLAAEEPEGVEAALAKILPTPEAYLAARGITFERPPETAPRPVAVGEGTPASSEERLLGRRVTAWPRRLLSVDAEFHDLTGKARRSMQLDFIAVVGADGRLREPRLQTFIGSTQEDLVKRALSVWRFEPARTGDQPVAARVPGRLILRIY